MVANYTVDKNKQFQKALNEAQKAVGDLTIPLTLIAKDWFKGNRAIFSLKGPGKYPDLMPKTKAAKKKHVGFVYPILEATGRLSASLTQPTNENAVNQIVNRTQLFLGTRLHYANYLQYGTKHMKPRPMVFIGPESKEFSDVKDIVQRQTIWTKILQDYVVQVSKVSGVGE